MTSVADNDKLIIGISSCLLGNPVRYDGDHCRHDEIMNCLEKAFTLLPFCPEVAIGLGVPRPPIHLVETKGEIKVRGVTDQSQDVTEALSHYALELSEQIEQLSGYIFKSRSPSCGIGDVKVYNETGEVIARSSGQFAKTIMQRYPDLPVGNDDDLSSQAAREAFIARVKDYALNNNNNRGS